MLQMADQALLKEPLESLNFLNSFRLLSGHVVRVSHTLLFPSHSKYMKALSCLGGRKHHLYHGKP